jgi:hypothetical protein
VRAALADTLAALTLDVRLLRRYQTTHKWDQAIRTAMITHRYNAQGEESDSVRLIANLHNTLNAF